MLRQDSRPDSHLTHQCSSLPVSHRLGEFPDRWWRCHESGMERSESASSAPSRLGHQIMKLSLDQVTADRAKAMFCIETWGTTHRERSTPLNYAYVPSYFIIARNNCCDDEWNESPAPNLIAACDSPLLPISAVGPPCPLKLQQAT